MGRWIPTANEENIRNGRLSSTRYDSLSIRFSDWKWITLSIRKRFKKRVIKTIIIKQFKALWAVKFHSLKRPQEYALLLNVSSVYLNEAVKKTTGYKCLCTEKRFNGNAWYIKKRVQILLEQNVCTTWICFRRSLYSSFH